VQSPETLEIVTNDAVIRINQDPAGAVANRLLNVPVTGGTLSLWQGYLADG
jgi:alpha-galactosidase